MKNESPPQHADADGSLHLVFGTLLALRLCRTLSKLLLTLFLHHLHVLSPILNLLSHRRCILINVEKLKVLPQVFTDIRLIIELVNILKNQVEVRRILSARHRWAVKRINVVELHLSQVAGALHLIRNEHHLLLCNVQLLRSFLDPSERLEQDLNGLERRRVNVNWLKVMSDLTCSISRVFLDHLSDVLLRKVKLVACSVFMQHNPSHTQVLVPDLTVQMRVVVGPQQIEVDIDC